MACSRICEKLNVFKLFTLFSQPLLPSFGDKLAHIDHEYDKLLADLFKRIQIQAQVAEYNPKPKDEVAVFNSAPNHGGPSIKTKMLLRNFLFLSRLFIRNAKLAELKDSFKSTSTLQILDLGCGYAPTLLGILAYFGIENVEYTGVDISSEAINANRDAYHDFKNVSFVCADAEAYLKEPSHRDKFQLILLQHPNIEVLKEKFAKIFQATDLALAFNGRVYSTFYYEPEVDYFRHQIRPHMLLRKGKISYHNNSFFGVSLSYPLTGEVYSPERHSFLSIPKSEVKKNK